MVDGVLGVGDVPAQVHNKGLDALHQLGQHKGEDGRDDDDEGQIGGEHRQRPGDGFVQSPVVQPEEKLTGPVENKGQAEADDEGLEHPQHRTGGKCHHIQPGQHHHQHHGVGDNQQNAFKQLFIHGGPQS